MTDYFALLGQPRRPWIDPDELQARFLALSREVHPDRFHNASEEQRQAANASSVELNAAYQRLRDAKDRLLHLLELELGRKPGEIQGVPEATMELFVQVGRVCREVDLFLAERAKVSSPMLKAQMFECALAWADRLQSMQQRVASNRAALEARLRAMNRVWEDATRIGTSARSAGLPLAELDEVYRQFGFLARWSGQLQERIVRLSL